MTEPTAVHHLARLFGRLWQQSHWDMPPDRRYTVEDREQAASTVTVTPQTGNGPIWTYEDQLTIAATIHDLVENAGTELVLATYSVANMTRGLPRMVAQPDLLHEPVRRALNRGVRVRLLLRGRNHVQSSRAEAAAFADAGVEVYADRYTHAKAVVADRRRGALFSANFETGHGLTGGVEVGIRLDGTPALTEALRYFEQYMAAVDMTFVRDPRLSDLHAGLGEMAGRLNPDERNVHMWPLPSTIDVVADDTSWRRLAEQAGPALFERDATGTATIHSGRDRWSLSPAADDTWALELRGRGRRPRKPTRR